MYACSRCLRVPTSASCSSWRITKRQAVGGCSCTSRKYGLPRRLVAVVPDSRSDSLECAKKRCRALLAHPTRTAYFGDVERPFRLMPNTRFGRSRTVISMSNGVVPRRAESGRQRWVSRFGSSPPGSTIVRLVRRRRVRRYAVAGDDAENCHGVRAGGRCGPGDRESRRPGWDHPR